LLESKVKGEEVEFKVETKKFPKIEYKSPRMKKRSPIITLKEEEVHREYSMAIRTLSRKQEEEEEAEEVK
jgi:hypothetical protein